MIDLYAMGSPNVVKIYIALEEMGLPYTVHPVDVFGEAQFSPEFLRLNPNAKVPVMSTARPRAGSPTRFSSPGPSWSTWRTRPGGFSRRTARRAMTHCSG